MRLAKALAMWFVVMVMAVVPMYGQISGPFQIAVYTSDPSGACANAYRWAFVPLDSTLWNCPAGTWTKFTGAASGVTSFSAGNLSPLFTSNVATATTTPALTFALVNQNANLVYAGPSSGGAAAPGFRALVGADLPNPAASTLGGIQSFASVSHQFLTQISTLGVVSAAQPAVGDLSNIAAFTVLGNPTNAGAAVQATTAPIISGAYQSLQSIGITGADGMELFNTTPATNVLNQNSPRLHWQGQGWRTTATAASQAVDTIMELRANTGTNNPSFSLAIAGQINGGGYADLIIIPSAGGFNVLSGTYQINGTQITCAALSDSKPSCSTDTTSASNISSGTLGTARLPANQIIRTVGGGFDGGGSALTSGATATVYFTVPFACSTFVAWNITVDTGTITFDVWKIATGTAIPTSANSITAAALPALSTGTALHSTSMSGWTTTSAANDIWGININTVATATKASFTLQCSAS